MDTKEPPDQEKDEKDGEDAAVALQELLAQQALGPHRFAMPHTRIRAFIDHLTIREARDVGPKLTVAMLAVSYLDVEGFEAEMSKTHLELIVEFAREHPNKRYRSFMAALRSNCESKNPDLPAVVWTLMEAQGLLSKVTPNWAQAVLIYSKRVGLLETQPEA